MRASTLTCTFEKLVGDRIVLPKKLLQKRREQSCDGLFFLELVMAINVSVGVAAFFQSTNSLGLRNHPPVSFCRVDEMSLY